MKKTGIFYASSTGNTKDVAEMIARDLNLTADNIYNVANTAPSAVADYDVILIGSSTYGSGEIQDDMADFLDGLEEIDLRGKTIAVFGCGDESMTDTFCNAVGEIYKRLQKTGAKFIGRFNTDGYEFADSEADINGSVVGLLIDNINHSELTEKRVRDWTDILHKEIA